MKKYIKILGGTIALIAALFVYKTNVGAVPTVTHGASIAKGCDTPKDAGDTASCSIVVGYNDAAGDTISIDEVWDVQDFGGDNVRVPVAGSLPISAISGNTTCTVAGSLPCKIGPAGSTLNGLPGAGTAGSVTFVSNTYVIEADDPTPLQDQGNARVHDLCDDENTSGCSTGSNLVQFTASTVVNSPTPTLTPSPTLTPTPTNTPTPTVTPTPTNTPTPTPPVGCTLTQGYWKNHPEDWPVNSLILGSVNYSKNQLLSILRRPVRGNGLVSLSHQLIVAKLNIADGASADAQTSQAISDADSAIGNKVVPPVGNGSLSTSSVSSLVSKLDSFNSGNTGPGHCR